MALLFISRVHDADAWLSAIKRHLPDLETRIWPAAGDPRDIEFALAWAPPHGLLATLPNLRGVSSFGAGVESLLADASLPPALPIARVVDQRLTDGMSEYMLLHVLRHHRQLDRLQANQRAARWQWFPPAPTPEAAGGIMGLGTLGQAVAGHFVRLGFKVLGWSRTPKQIPGVTSFAGDAQRDDFLARCNYLVCLLPMTPATRGIINRATLAKLPRGAVVINAGRGDHVVEEDLLAALDSRHIAAATLDVFAEEPLPPRHRFWSQPHVTVTPHNAADSIPESVAPQIAANIRRALAGQPMLNLVDQARGY
jgi:glyoxylate/hydroxypyruvate reductase A